MMRIILAVAACVLLLDNPATAQQPQPNLGKLLADVVAGKAPLDDVRLDAHWPGNVRGASVTVYGNGVGIWRREKQFNLKPEQVRSLLERLQKAKFTEMPPRFGGLAIPAGGPRPGVPERLMGSITLQIGKASYGVSQLGGGEQSQALADLIIGVINQCSEWARDGVGADNLADGLKKIGERKLDPLTLSVLVHRIQGEGTGPDGWLFRMEGNVVITRDKTAKGYGPEVRYELPRKQLEEVLKLLLDNEAGGLPINLFATDYTDFTVSVLDKNKNLQARRFARLTPQTHGERQKQFDRIFAGLHRLHQQALKEGTEIKEKQ